MKKYLPEVRREIEVRREMWMVEYVVQIFCAAAASLGCARPKLWERITDRIGSTIE